MSLILIKGEVLDVIEVRYSTFAGPNNAIISDSCDYIEAQVGILIKFIFHAFQSRILSPPIW